MKSKKNSRGKAQDAPLQTIVIGHIMPLTTHPIHSKRVIVDVKGILNDPETGREAMASIVYASRQHAQCAWTYDR